MGRARAGPDPPLKRDATLKTIGLMGGSFNPAHQGHRAISLFAMDSLGLDAFWWMVSPGNPLKPKTDMAPLPARMASAKAQARGTPIKITAIEREFGTVYTAESLQKLVARYPKTRFIWIMGADNLMQFHHLSLMVLLMSLLNMQEYLVLLKQIDGLFLVPMYMLYPRNLILFHNLHNLFRD